MNRRFSMTWPFLCLVACLFVLSVSAPRTWEKAVRYRNAEPISPPQPYWGEALSASKADTPSKDPSKLTPVPGAALLTDSSDVFERGHVLLEEPEEAEAQLEMEPTLEYTSAPADADTVATESELASVDPLAAIEEGPAEEVATDQPDTPALMVPTAEDEPAGSEPLVKPLPALTEVAEVTAEAPEEPQIEVPEEVWPTPQALLDRLEELAWDCKTGEWAREVAHQIRQLGPAVASRSDEALMIIERLNDLAREASTIAAELEREANPLLGQLRRTQHAMGRRLDIWRRVLVAGGPGEGVSPPIDAPRLASCLEQIDALLGDSEAGKPWREYLRLEALALLAKYPTAYDEDSVRRVTLTVWKRLTQTGLTARQQQFLTRKPLVELAATLEEYLYGTVNLGAVLRHVENVEREGLTSDARLLADDCACLARSPVAEHQSLGQRIELHYRNANVRVAVTEELLNRMMPEREPQFQYVHDQVLGRPVHGQSVTSTEVEVKLIPDPRRLRLALEINGQVAALTASTAGPATFYNDSESTYVARKEIELTPQGLKLWPAQVEVYNDLSLRSLRTTLDPIPLVGSLVKEVARSQHEQSRPAVSREVERKVAVRAKQQIDGEANARLGHLSRRLQDRFVEPFAALSLGPTWVSAHTSDVRMTMRLRFGSEEQLGGWTPRPQAPSDSLLSVQMHESTINNIIEQLQLDGGTFTVAELRQRIAQRFNRPEMLEETSSNDDVLIRFADKDAARVRCQDGCVVVTLSIERLSRSPHHWRNFQIRAFYRPEQKGRSVELVRDGVVRLTGDRLNTGAQIALRGIFSKTFSRERPWTLTPQAVLNNPRMAQIGVTQCVIEDGWIGLAFGPVRPGTPSLVARRADADEDAE